MKKHRFKNTIKVIFLMKEISIDIDYLNDKFKIKKGTSKGKYLIFTKDYDGLTTQVYIAGETGSVLKLGISREAKTILGNEKSEALEILASKYNSTLTVQSP